MKTNKTIPQWIWQFMRLLVFATFVAIAIGLFKLPNKTLIIFWGILVPLLPIVFWIFPGLWRNVCPLATANQIPRKLKFSLSREVPDKLKWYSGIIGITLLFIAIPLRKIILNTDALVLFYTLIIMILSAFIGGVLFKGKSGWCGSFCPLLPVQRLYGQTPLVVVNNNHCKPCVGCIKNCYDINPKGSYLVDLYDADPILSNDRKFFAGMMPGLLLAYFLIPYSSETTVYQLYLQFGLYCLVGIGAYQALETTLKLSPQKNTALFAVISLNIFYWFSSNILQDSLQHIFSIQIIDSSIWIFRIGIFLYSLYWLYRTFTKEHSFLAQTFSSQARTNIANIRYLKKHDVKPSDGPIVEIQPSGEQLVAKPEMTLLDLLETNNHKINSGCRMGACGADPIAILDGGDQLPEKSPEEQATLDRLGYKTGVRMACCVKITNNISINLDPQSAQQVDDTLDFEEDKNIKSVIIIGNGIAGVTAADFIRRYHKHCQIHLISQEKYPLYNRMTISKLIHGRASLQSLILMPDVWYSSRNIQQWLNTQVRSIETIKQLVKLATGEVINYDRLIIATGSSAKIPDILNWPMKGCYALRSAEDGMSIRTYLQDHHCKRVVIGGGGLLGLEAAYAFTQVGLKVIIIERSSHLLKRQLDSGAASILHTYLSALGIMIVYNAEIKSVISDDNITNKDTITGVTLQTKELILTDMALIATGIVTNKKLTKKTELAYHKGLLVDDHLRTNIKNIYAAGDIAELKSTNGQLPGLWLIAVEQGRIAAVNALGGNQVYQDKPIATVLKVAEIELTSMGQFIAKEKDREFIIQTKNQYRKIVIQQEKIVGCILLGHPEYFLKISRYISSKELLSEQQLTRLGEDNWSMFH
jgi:NADPH-dependent 2,4-dienoyl-CoA reductase/sulfur reductase-like enzyme/ferredoxin